MKKIIIDTLGGDSFDNIMQGTVMAAQVNPDIGFILIGERGRIWPHLMAGAITSRCEIIECVESISNDEPPTVVKNRSNSSIHIGLKMLKEGCDHTKEHEYIAFISAGSTGAVLAGAVLMIGRIPGVLRPALCPLLPSPDPKKRTMIIDVGANMDCKPEYLLGFAKMGSVYMKSIGVKNPRIGLVNVGTEDKKGNELTTATFALLKESDLNFVGNMEANDAFTGKFDVIVCDGFVGNILLKGAEGAFKLLGTKLRETLTSSFKAKIGAVLVKKKFENMRKELGADTVGGSIFIGTKKPVVKAHGSSSPFAFYNAILTGINAGRSDLTKLLEKEFAEK
ncbi:MAG: phosphate acyltransferase PlsX [Firmicutes bacterium]|nr:phosphate acyltransferase PlsX [Bacillota bacterium]